MILGHWRLGALFPIFLASMGGAGRSISIPSLLLLSMARTRFGKAYNVAWMESRSRQGVVRGMEASQPVVGRA
jgi:hypothetical protein